MIRYDEMQDIPYPVTAIQYRLGPNQSFAEQVWGHLQAMYVAVAQRMHRFTTCIISCTDLESFSVENAPILHADESIIPYRGRFSSFKYYNVKDKPLRFGKKL